MEVVGLLAVLAYLATHAPTVFTWNALPWVVVTALASWRLWMVWG